MHLYRHIGVAAAFSPRLRGLLAEAARHFGALAPRLSLIHAGAHTPEAEAHLRRAAEDAGLPGNVEIFWEEGEPDEAILRAVDRAQVDLVVAGALEKERPLRYYLGSVAHNLVREAPCSVLLFTEPKEQPEPMRRLVVVTDYSENAQIAFARSVRFAEQEQAEIIHVLRVLPEYGEAMTLADGVRKEQARRMRAETRAREEQLLRDFVDAAGRSRTPIETNCIEGWKGLVAAQFVRDVGADLLVMPSANGRSHFFTRLFPSDMEWVLREIPCNLWVARERLEAD